MTKKKYILEVACFLLFLYNIKATSSQCPNTCIYCQDNNSCVSCLARYYLNQGECITCMQHCYNCTNANTCLNCYCGYKLVNNTCLPSANSSFSDCYSQLTPNTPTSSQISSEDSGSRGYAIYLGIGLGALALVIFVTIFICKKCKEGQKSENTRGSIRFGSSKDFIFDDSSKEKKRGKKTLKASQPCPICHVQAANLFTQCGHSFHVLCLKVWTQTQPICPQCQCNLNILSVRVYCAVCLVYIWEGKIDEVNIEHLICSECNK